MVILLGCLSLFAILLEISRKKWDTVESLFEKHFNFMLRQGEFDGGLTGATWLLFGSTITVFLFPIQIAVPSLLFLTVGDAFAAIIGKGIPIGKIGDKYLSNMDSTIFHFLRLISNRIANKHKQPNKITIISLSWMNHIYPNGIMDEKR